MDVNTALIQAIWLDMQHNLILPALKSFQANGFVWIFHRRAVPQAMWYGPVSITVCKIFHNPIDTVGFYMYNPNIPTNLIGLSGGTFYDAAFCVAAAM